MKISRIRVTSGGTFGTILRVIFLAMILGAVAFGFARKAEAQIMTSQDRYDNPSSQHLYDAGVSFIYLRNADTYLIMRSGTPPTLVEGYTTPVEVCNALRPHRLPNKVVVYTDTGPRGSICE